MRIFITIILSVILFAACEKEISTSPPDRKLNEGKIIVKSSPPDFFIFLNERNSGKLTPDSIRLLDPGLYNVTLKKDFFKDTTIQIDLALDEQKDIFFDILSNPSMFGKLEIITDPDGATVSLNDSVLANTSPVFIQNILPGEYSIKLELEGHRSQQFVTQVRSSQKTLLQPTLRDTTVWVDFNVNNSDIQSNLLTTIDIDSDGDLWMGTSDKGIIRYDGVNFTNYSTINSGIPSNSVNSVFVDNLNNIWIGTDQGVAQFNGSSWIVYDRNNSNIPNNNIISVKSFNGEIFVGTPSGLAGFTAGSWINYENVFNPGNSFWAEDFVIDLDGSQWIGTNTAGIIRRNSTQSIQYLDSTHAIPTNNISSAAITLTGEIWFTHLSVGIQRGGISIFSASSIENLFFGSVQIKPNSIYVDDNNGKWVATDEGIFHFDPSNGFVQYRVGPDLISSNNTTDVVIDNQGTIWITTFGGGLNKFKIQNR